MATYSDNTLTQGQILRQLDGDGWAYDKVKAAFERLQVELTAAAGGAVSFTVHDLIDDAIAGALDLATDTLVPIDTAMEAAQRMLNERAA